MLRTRARQLCAPRKDSELIDAAIQGMVSNLDPHSSYMDAKMYGDMQITTKGQFGGIGIEVTQEDGLIKVISPIDGTPAAMAGILTNDKIVALDGTDVTGLTLDQAVDKMRGGINTPITLTIVRDGADKPFDVKLVRAEIKVQAVRSEAKNDIGYIRITSFSEQTFDGLKKAVRDLKADRSRHQGLCWTCATIPADCWTRSSVDDSPGEIVSSRSRMRKTRCATRQAGDITDGKPLC
jgi:carboxyl-terminal processing protease